LVSCEYRATRGRARGSLTISILLSLGHKIGDKMKLFKI
jgi:hypothetical protein